MFPAEGVNNLYKLKKSKHVGKHIPEQAILETMHVATFFNILQSKPGLDFI